MESIRYVEMHSPPSMAVEENSIRDNNIVEQIEPNPITSFLRFTTVFDMEEVVKVGLSVLKIRNGVFYYILQSYMVDQNAMEMGKYVLSKHMYQVNDQDHFLNSVWGSMSYYSEVRR